MATSRLQVGQRGIVLSLALLLFVLFSVVLRGFLSFGNLLSLLQSISVIGTLAIGMALVIVGRGMDLSMIAVAVMPVAWTFIRVSEGASPEGALLGALIVALAVGVLNGWLVAYVEVPAIFATLATGTIVYGGMQFLAVSVESVPVPEGFQALSRLIRGTVFGIPNTVLFFAAIAAMVGLFLKYTAWGRYIYAAGDNPLAARATGVPIRPIILLQYVLSALVALAAGIVLASSVESANLRLFNSTMIYDVILIVVLGGIGLGGGRGGVTNVLVGALLIGVVLNGMTIMDLDYSTQNLIKASILLLAITIDSIINPRDEQISQQGDI